MKTVNQAFEYLLNILALRLREAFGEARSHTCTIAPLGSKYQLQPQLLIINY